MVDRVVIVLDVTMEEARTIAERIAGAGPYYKAYNLPILLDEAEEAVIPAGGVPHVSLRSDASSALGGPNMPDLAKRED